MENFKIGDEVTLKFETSWIDETGSERPSSAPEFGAVYLVIDIELIGKDVFLAFDEFPTSCWLSTKFAKVQRRDLTAWLATATTFEGPRRLHPEPAVDALFRRIMAGDVG